MRRELFEAAVDRYWQMMEPIYSKVIPSLGLESEFPAVHQELMKTRGYARGLVKFAYEQLKKQDRVTWFIKRARIAILRDLVMRVNAASNRVQQMSKENDEITKQRAALVVNAVRPLHNLSIQEMNSLLSKSGVQDEMRAIRSSDIDNEINEITKVIQRVSQTPSHLDNEITQDKWVRMFREINHFFSQNIPSIQNYTFPSLATPWSVIKNDLFDLEEEYKEKAGKFIPMGASDVEPTVIIQYENGAQWLNLNKSWCDLEGRAMGHCGNSGAGPNSPDDRILSFRTIEKNPYSKKKEWVPHLTFVLHEDGQLGEMKGRNNQKPDKKYHGVIVDLLRLPMIEGIVGGGYLPENNFSVSDLPQEVADQLMEEKPGLADFRFLYRKFGLQDERTKKEISTILNEYGLHDVRISEDGSEVYLYKWQNIDTFSKEEKEVLPNLTRALWLVLDGDIEEQWYLGDLNDEAETVLMVLSTSERQKIFNYIVENVDPDFIREWEETQRDLTTDGDDIYLFLHDNEGLPELSEVEHILDVARQASMRGYSVGANNQYVDAIKDWFKDPSPDRLPHLGPSFAFQGDEGVTREITDVLFFNAAILLVQDADDFATMLIEETDFLDEKEGEYWIDSFEFEDFRADFEPTFDEKAAVENFKELVEIEL